MSDQLKSGQWGYMRIIIINSYIKKLDLKITTDVMASIWRRKGEKLILQAFIEHLQWMKHSSGNWNKSE